MKEKDIELIAAAANSLNDFRRQNPSITSAEMQAYVLGWNAAYEYIKNNQNKWSHYLN